VTHTYGYKRVLAGVAAGIGAGKRSRGTCRRSWPKNGSEVKNRGEERGSEKQRTLGSEGGERERSEEHHLVYAPRRHPPSAPPARPPAVSSRRGRVAPDARLAAGARVVPTVGRRVVTGARSRGGGGCSSRSAWCRGVHRVGHAPCRRCTAGAASVEASWRHGSRHHGASWRRGSPRLSGAVALRRREGATAPVSPPGNYSVRFRGQIQDSQKECALIASLGAIVGRLVMVAGARLRAIGSGIDCMRWRPPRR